jgi:molybdopterin biosynthesis enzyme MoaB
MNLPEEFRIIIITLSDRASKGEYKDLSGPRIREIISDWFKTTGWNFSVTNKLIPDDG